MRRLLSIGVLEHLASPWAANNVFVPRNDLGVCVTTNFRALSNVTITDAYPMEDVNNVLDWLSSKKMFSMFDLKDGFYKFKLGEEPRPLTAMKTVLELLQYTNLPQDLKNSPSTFQR